MKTFKKILIITILVLLLVLGGWIFIHFFWVFGTGVKAGELNQVVYKGWVWKTYEGRLIQSGFNSHKTGALQSNEFNFSITDTQVAEKLMLCSGKVVEVRYKEYRGALPWRGMQRYIVYKIESVSEPYHSGVPDFPISPDGDAI